MRSPKPKSTTAEKQAARMIMPNAPPVTLPRNFRASKRVNILKGRSARATLMLCKAALSPLRALYFKLSSTIESTCPPTLRINSGLIGAGREKQQFIDEKAMYHHNKEVKAIESIAKKLHHVIPCNL
jgi:hypothetical protein